MRLERFVSHAAAMALWGGTLSAQPTITSQPASQTVLAGSGVLFSVSAQGTAPLKYRWQFNNTDLPNDIIKTVAGTGYAGYSGDGGPATNARVWMFGSLAFDSFGNLYLPEVQNSRVRKVDTNGIITTFAGNGSRGYSGDGGPATNASLNGPSGLAFDLSGNLYIADGGNNRVRKVDTDGTITTMAGNGTPSYSGDGMAATNAELHGASGVCLDSLDNVYVADFYNNRIRKVATNGIITTVAGTGNSGFYGDGQQAILARLNSPFSVIVDSSNNLYIADRLNCRIRKVSSSGIITTVAGNGGTTYSGDGGQATNASLLDPDGIAMDTDRNLYIADTLNSRIRKVDANGIITTAAGNGSTDYSGDGGAATNAGIVQPSGLAVDMAGNLFINAQAGVREVPYSGCPTLVLPQVTTSDAGSYTVIITSPGGSITSAVATLTVLVPPSISSIIPQSNGTVLVSFSGTPNTTNRLWSAASLSPPVVWAPVATNVTDTGGAGHFIDCDAAGWTTRFYRASMPWPGRSD